MIIKIVFKDKPIYLISTLDGYKLYHKVNNIDHILYMSLVLSINYNKVINSGILHRYNKIF